MDPQDVKIIESIPLNKTNMADKDGCHFTKNGKYTVKSDYQVERFYPDKEKPPVLVEPTVDSLEAFCWKIQCPPKIKLFCGNWCQDV